MGYVTVKEDTDEKLHLCREPSAKAWAILVGCTSLGLGAAFYSYDYLFWKVAYIAGAIFVGISCFENWEDCIFDKKKKQVFVKSQNIIQRTFPSQVATNLVSASLDELDSVEVCEEEVKYAGTGYIIILCFETGIKLGVTETASLGDKSEHEAMAEKIIAFTGLDKKYPTGSDFTEDITQNDSDTSDDEDNVVEDVTESDVITKEAEEEEEDVPSIEQFINVQPKVSPNQQKPVTVIEDKTTTDASNPQDDSSNAPAPLPDTPDSTSSDEGFEKIEKSAVENIEDLKI